MITRQEKGLWAAVIILAAGVLFMGSLIVIRGLKPAGELFTAEGEQDGTDAVASFGGEFITESEWVQELKRTQGHEALLQMLNQRAVNAEAQALQIKVTSEEVTEEINHEIEGYASEEAYYQEMATQLDLTPEEIRAEAAYRLTLEKIATADIRISDDEVSSYVNQHKDEFTPKKEYHLAWIKVGNDKEANQILDRLERDESFGKLAQELSLDEFTRKQGGDLGLIEEDDPFIPEEVLRMAATLSVGDIAGPVKLKDGYAVIQVMDIINSGKQNTQDILREVRRRLALNEAVPLSQLEENLRNKYDAKILTKVPDSKAS